MGRVKKYAGGHRRSKSQIKNKTSKIDGSGSDNAMSDDGDAAQASITKTMTIGKKRQLFKKSKDGRRDIKKQILELKRLTSKLKKRNLNQKSEKKKIAKEIKELKVSVVAIIDRVPNFVQTKMRNCNLDETDLKTEEENQWVDVDVDEDDDADAKV